MSAPKKPLKNDYRIPEGSGWAGAWKIAAGVGALGIAGSAAGYFMDPTRFAFSYLFAFFLFLTLGLGAIFFILVERLTSAGWSITVRRTAEFFAAGMPVFLILFLPLLACMGTLYPWLHEKAGESGLVPEAHAQEQAPEHATHAPGQGHDPVSGKPDQANAPAHPESPHGSTAAGAAHFESGHMGVGGHAGNHEEKPGPEEATEEETLAKKHAWLNKGGFIARAVFYFAVWAWLGTTFFGFSTRQDSSKDPKLTVKAQSLAPIATFLFGFTLTGAAFDWLMSLLPTWYSTIYGVTIFAGSVVTIYATLIVVTMSLNAAGHLKNAVNVEHYHDLGKLLFGFLVFWAYVSFAQYMLIWYASIPEEVTFYHHRWDVGPWKTVSTIIIICHFIVPFFIILSRNAKRKLGLLRFGAVWLLVMHAVEMYWMVMPYYANGEVSFHWLDLVCVLAVGGTYLAFVLHRMARFPLIPVGDPRLSRALTFENA